MKKDFRRVAPQFRFVRRPSHAIKIRETRAQDSIVSRPSVLPEFFNSLLGACGGQKNGEITLAELSLILPGLLAWVTGEPLAEIEKKLGGEPDSSSLAKQVCPRARDLVGSVIPRGISFIVGLVSHIVEEVDPFDQQVGLSRQLVETLGTAVRKGFDTPEKVFFAGDHPTILGRVQAHTLWNQEHANFT